MNTSPNVPDAPRFPQEDPSKLILRRPKEGGTHLIIDLSAFFPKFRATKHVGDGRDFHLLATMISLEVMFVFSILFLTWVEATSIIEDSIVFTIELKGDGEFLNIYLFLSHKILHTSKDGMYFHK
jgi:hypothetical protein